jgi:2-phosphoglycolate phosphatase
MPGFEAVFFDLDGTLIDTAPDMGGALNQLLVNHRLPTLTASDIRPHVSNGAIALINLGFRDRPNDEKLEILFQEYLQIYSDNLARESRLFAGMESTLAAIEERELPWGVITNKLAWLTEPLLEQLGLLQRCACVVSADTCERRKPHPMPMFHACDLVGVAAGESIYVGDAIRDVEAGNAAGMTTIVASYGYILEDEPISSWQADGCIASPEDLLSWL